LDGNVHEGTKEETDLLATVAAKQSNRAGKYMGGELGYKPTEIAAPLIWPHQEFFCNWCYVICFINYTGEEIQKEKTGLVIGEVLLFRGPTQQSSFEQGKRQFPPNRIKPPEGLIQECGGRGVLPSGWVSPLP